MNLWFVLILLGIITYAVVERSISKITKTPVWLCWLVMMLPAILWTVWSNFNGDVQPPLTLIFIPLVVCPLIYSWLIQIGRIAPEPNSESNPESNKDKATDSPENEAPELAEEATQPLRPINSEEETALRNCFPWNIYYLQHIDYRPQAILCRGKLKTVPEEAYKRIKKNVEGEFGDRFFLIFQESFRGQPFFALVPNPTADQSDATKSLTRPGLALLLLLITALTTTVAGVELQNFTQEQIQAQPELILQGLYYSIPLLLILLVHELGHYFATRAYKIDCTLPYLIPIPFFLGTLGAFVQRKTPLPNRQALFDIAIAGPMAGFILTLPILYYGLTQSQTVPLVENNLFDFSALDPSLSFCFALIAKVAMGNQLTPDVAIQLHPIAIAGYLGFLLTAFNLMPVGQLDGGHIVHAVFGQRMAIAIGQISRFVAIVFALINPAFWVWTIILWFMPLLDRPALNDITELDNLRDLGGLLALALLLFILLPLPPTVANWIF